MIPALGYSQLACRRSRVQLPVEPLFHYFLHSFGEPFSSFSIFAHVCGGKIWWFHERLGWVGHASSLTYRNCFFFHYLCRFLVIHLLFSTLNIADCSSWRQRGVRDVVCDCYIGKDKAGLIIMTRAFKHYNESVQFKSLFFLRKVHDFTEASFYVRQPI